MVYFFTTQEQIQLRPSTGLQQKAFSAIFLCDAYAIYLAPSAFESGFISSAHTDNDIEQTLRSVERAFNYFDYWRELICPPTHPIIDIEWGVPLYNERQLFEFLILEGMRADLNWLTIF